MGIFGNEFGFPHLVVILVVLLVWALAVWALVITIRDPKLSTPVKVIWGILLLVFPYFSLIIWAIDRFVRLNRRDRDY